MSTIWKNSLGFIIYDNEKNLKITNFHLVYNNEGF